MEDGTESEMFVLPHTIVQKLLAHIHKHSAQIILIPFTISGLCILYFMPLSKCLSGLQNQGPKRLLGPEP